MARFTIGITKYGVNSHVNCFLDFARAMADALRTLGHEVVDFTNPGRLIMFGAGQMTDPTGEMPADTILYNAEQVSASSEVAQINAEQYRKFTVWDYSASNIAKLRELGIERAVHCPVGYMPSMWTIKNLPDEQQDIDVLFYGSVNPRRAEILDALDAAGLKVERLFGVYGAERDAFIARSKIVLNLHFYDNPVFEIFRCSHLFANLKPVVSEDGGQDVELEAFASRATMLVSRDKIVETCAHLARKGRKGEFHRIAQGDVGFFEFTKLSLVEHVRKALDQS